MNLTLVWLLVFAVMIVFEVVTVGNLVSLWFALGALAALAVSFVSDSLPLQIIVFAVTSLVSLLLVRPIASRFLKGNVVATNADSIIGRQLTLSQAIEENTWGQIELQGTTWSVTTIDQSPVEKGQRVEVLAIEGVKLIVKKVEAS